MANKLRIGQKVTLFKSRWHGFYAPVNCIVVEVETSLHKNDLTRSFGLQDYIGRCETSERYTVAYEQCGFIDKIERIDGLQAHELEAGWHGMKRNGDDEEFARFGVSRVNGQLVQE